MIKSSNRSNQENVDVTYKYGGTGLGLSIVKRFTGVDGWWHTCDERAGEWQYIHR